MNATEIKAKADEIVTKLTASKSAVEKFKSNPTQTVKSFLPTDVSSDIVSKIVDAVKAKINIDGISSAVSSLSGLFKK